MLIVNNRFIFAASIASVILFVVCMLYSQIIVNRLINDAYELRTKVMKLETRFEEVEDTVIYNAPPGPAKTGGKK